MDKGDSWTHRFAASSIELERARVRPCRRRSTADPAAGLADAAGRTPRLPRLIPSRSRAPLIPTTSSTKLMVSDVRRNGLRMLLHAAVARSLLSSFFLHIGFSTCFAEI